MLGIVAAPFAGEPFAFELLDPMGRDLVQNHRPERLVQHLQDVAIALRAAFIELGMILQIGFRELLEGDVRLSSDARGALLKCAPGMIAPRR